MDSFLITNIGLEEVAAKEVKEILGVESKTEESVVTFKVAKLEELCKLTYLSQSASKVVLLLGKGKVKDSDDAVKLVESIDKSMFSEWLVKGKTFAVHCSKAGDQDLSSQEIAEEVGAVIFKQVEAKVKLKNPDVTVLVYCIDDMCYVGIDFSGFDLSKREYKVFQQGNPVKGTVAYGILRIAGFEEGQTVLDPFASNGLVPIEAAFFASKKSPRFYQKDEFAFHNFACFEKFDFDAFFEKIDKVIIEPESKIFCVDPMLRDIKSAQKNAKAAGVNKLLTFSRVDTEWLDTKFDLESVDCIVTVPPQPSKRVAERKLQKIYEEFFYSAGEILKKNGKLVVLMKNEDYFLEIAEKKQFSVETQLEVHQGQDELVVLILKSNKK